ncbi:response regulator transcription factor [Solitalea canadensis]|uniref:Response regulator with CheY-like receiver domain and winged-helix DNA-binding domain n=1 Tax=Solitalea canadensis (strain ATCC 29591 / DSM 3403 / JCM 21819 / LMG 8368 / NBRC 15130 / NCIMB 12057 / USAM 9D) TaxID=929556 RepID=H8KM09_SOLCM|nr:response regulator transcription factor [Solitalea canadensis]AFD08931.1 response regulator with CheY-like receiver domain and winged-helix DNA-binding domain [Solitalea canadensis DSM 3403]
MSKSVLLVEDDPNLGMILQEYLQLKGGYTVKLCIDGVQALDVFKSNTFDVCILDVMMPKKDGFTLGKEIRELDEKVPIIFATAKSMLEDKIAGFNIGGDDYITKPFRIEELLLRINALLKRSSNTLQEEKQPDKYQVGSILFNPMTQEIHNGYQSQKLSAKESELLHLLCQHKNDVLSREQALIAIWGNDNYFNARSMDVYISKLRKLLKGDDSVEIINVHGRGYKLIF